MNKFVKWTGLVVAGLIAAALLGLVWVNSVFERELGRKFTTVDTTQLIIPTDDISVAEGKRVAQLAGCLHCHGENLAGALVDDIPGLVRMIAPNASVILPEYSNTQLATLLRKGVKPDGGSVLFMPSEMFRHLGDEDLARLIAWLRTVPATTNGPLEQTEVRLLGRVLLAKGDLKTSAHAIETLPAAVEGFQSGDALAKGRYLVMNYCSECHGQSLQGFPPINAPPLVVAKGYTLGQFDRLMRDGIGLGNREFLLMTPTSRARFAHFTAEETASMHAFLQSN